MKLYLLFGNAVNGRRVEAFVIAHDEQEAINKLNAPAGVKQAQEINSGVYAVSVSLSD